MDKYSWSFREYDEIYREGADSIDACICQAKAAADDENTVYIGKNVAFVPSVDAELVLDNLQDQASDECGVAADDWDAYDCKTMQPELEELSAELTAITMAWLKKHGREPNFCSLEDVSTYSLSKPEED